MYALKVRVVGLFMTGLEIGYPVWYLRYGKRGEDHHLLQHARESGVAREGDEQTRFHRVGNGKTNDLVFQYSSFIEVSIVSVSSSKCSPYYGVPCFFPFLSTLACPRKSGNWSCAASGPALAACWSPQTCWVVESTSNRCLWSSTLTSRWNAKVTYTGTLSNGYIYRHSCTSCPWFLMSCRSTLPIVIYLFI